MVSDPAATPPGTKDFAQKPSRMLRGRTQESRGVLVTDTPTLINVKTHPPMQRWRRGRACASDRDDSPAAANRRVQRFVNFTALNQAREIETTRAKRVTH